MAIINQTIKDNYALYHGDCMEVLPEIPDTSIHLSIYSPPFGGLYFYSSDERDMSNCTNYDQFFEHYEFLVREIHRVTMPGRITAVHCMDIPLGVGKGFTDFPGDIIRLHQRCGFDFAARHFVWKEPLGVRLRTMAKGLAHKQIVDDSSLCDVAAADHLIIFRKRGQNPIPISHPVGLTNYAGERKLPSDVLHLQGYNGDQKKNRFSHWIWRQYASAFWDDIRIKRVLPYKKSREPEDEKHIHPLQLDVIERIIILRSNPWETVLTPFMGVGSEVYGALINNRKAIGIELKGSYYKQACNNVRDAKRSSDQGELNYFAKSQN